MAMGLDVRGSEFDTGGPNLYFPYCADLPTRLRAREEFLLNR
jgi:hypothetical protein